MAGRDIIVVGCSAGGIEALTTLVRGLPSGFPASLFVVCHLPTGVRSALPEILSREGALLASHAGDDEPFYPGHIYLAPPDRHLLLAPDRKVRLSRAARENRHRPAVDPLFRSAARYYGDRVIGLILSGALSDGVAGMLAVRAGGGLALVQDPADALVAGMPRGTLEVAGADHIARAAELAPLLTSLVRQAIPDRSDPMTDPDELMQEIVEQDMDRQSRDGRHGEVSVFTCPECGGALWQVRRHEMIQFRCHVGHVYNGDVLLSEQSEALEAALWTAVRTFREKSILAIQLANRARAEGNVDAAARFDEQARQASRYGSLIRQYLLGDDGDDPGAGPADGPSAGGQP